MRTKPIGTGPFKFVEFKRNESIKLVRNPDYWKKGQPYLDAIEWQHHRQPLDAHAGLRRRRVRHDLRRATSRSPLLKDVKAQAPKADLRAAADQRSAPT